MATVTHSFFFSQFEIEMVSEVDVLGEIKFNKPCWSESDTNASDNVHAAAG